VCQSSATTGTKTIRSALPVIETFHAETDMQGDQPISWLMFFTLAATIFIIAGAFIFFLRSRTNRAIAAHALEGEGRGRGLAPDGAAPELIGVAVLAVALMGLLATGYSQRGSAERLAATPAATSSTTGMAQPAGSADDAKKWQPANPAPDTRGAPTGSTTGIGSENGNTGQPQ
jgi:hypothetical protein